MGNNHSHENGPRADLSRSNSSPNFEEKTSPTRILPIGKLAKILTQKSLEEDSIQGISCRVFVKYVFPHNFDLAQRLFNYFHSSSGKMKHEWISEADFITQAENYLGIMIDARVIDLFLKMYSGPEGNDITQEEFHNLLMTVYKLAMEFYPEGKRTCAQTHKTLEAVTSSAFHKKTSVPRSYLAHWVAQHCPYLLMGIHKYAVHVLSTAYRVAGEPQVDTTPAGMDLSTPVLEREINFQAEEGEMLPLSQVWLLAMSLSPLYTKPSQHHSPSSSAVGLCSQTFISKILGSICPSHWVQLYNSNHHGIGANRFMHHVLNYRGPSLVFLRGEEGVQFCVAVSSEWKESHLYWGTEDCSIIQMAPLYHVVERGAKLIYMNTSIRGYPKGIRAGSDPRKPTINLDDGFSVVNFIGIPYPLITVEVWGCGTQELREAQLDIKKWQVRQAEKQRQVKISASDWVDHPDRYLLELAGRTSYNADNNTSSSKANASS